MSSALSVSSLPLDDALAVPVPVLVGQPGEIGFQLRDQILAVGAPPARLLRVEADRVVAPPLAVNADDVLGLQVLGGSRTPLGAPARKPRKTARRNAGEGSSGCHGPDAGHRR